MWMVRMVGSVSGALWTLVALLLGAFEEGNHQREASVDLSEVADEPPADRVLFVAGSGQVEQQLADPLSTKP